MQRRNKLIIFNINTILFILALCPLAGAQTIQKKTAAEVSKVWVSDLGNGKYKNPVLNADYSDPFRQKLDSG